MRIKHYFFISSLLAGLSLAANQQPTGNRNPAYAPSHVQAQLRLNVRDDAEAIHFIRDTNDPKIITKAYVLKHADPYSIRPYLREMVQSLRVDYNNAAGRANADYYNTYSKSDAAGEKLFVPTGVECIRYNDGTGILLVSAEKYRFEDSVNGMGLDSLVEKLDQPGLLNSSGQPKYLYFPVNRPASELLKMIKLVGANLSNDTVELIGGKDKIELDEEMNCLFFNTALYSRKNIEEMLRIYDVPHPEVRIRCTVYELESENDGTLGVDFQSWKNNDGLRLLSTGAEFSRNRNLATLPGPITPDGTINTNYFHFEPKWNSKFLDFLVSKGKAKIACSGDLAIENGAVGTLERTSGVMYAKLTPIEPPPGQETSQSGNQVDVKPINEQFKFQLKVTPSINAKASTLDLTVDTVSMLGYDSTGAVRSSKFSTTQKVMLNNERGMFYLGGIEKIQLLRDVGGLPFFKDLPVLGWLFATERESTKKSQLVVVAECEIVQPGSLPDATELEKINLIRGTAASASEFNRFGYRQYGLDAER